MSTRRRREPGGRPRRSGPRKLPPDETGRENEDYRALVDEGRTVVARTRSGESFRGRLEAFDESTVSIRTEDVGTVRLARRELRSIATD